jgi:hypothetical protein
LVVVRVIAQVQFDEHNSWRQFLDYDTPLHAVCGMSDSTEDAYVSAITRKFGEDS